MKYAFPSTYGENCILVPIDAALVPLVSGALLHFQLRGYWQTDADYEQGYNAFAELQEDMSGRCIVELIESQNRIYRLLDTSLNGTAYTASADVVPTITPAIPAVPDSGIGQAPGLRKQLLDAQGIINAGWFGIGGQPATMADIVGALRIGSSDDTTRITDAIDSITAESGLAQLSQASNVLGVVKGLFTDVAGGVGEGAILGTLIATAIAQAAMLGTMAGQIDRLIASIDGGGQAGPSDNVLMALRGTTEASETRNVIDALASNATTINDTLSVIVDNTLNTADNTLTIAASTATIDGNISAIADNTSNTAASVATIDGNISAIADNTLNTADNTLAIAASTATIDGNISAIADNTSNTAASIATIDGNITAIADNTLTTAGNTGGLAADITATANNTQAMIERLDTVISDAELLTSLLTDVRTLLS